MRTDDHLVQVVAHRPDGYSYDDSLATMRRVHAGLTALDERPRAVGPREAWEVRGRLLAIHARLPARVCPQARGALLGLVLRVADRPPPAAAELARALRAAAAIVTTTCPGSATEAAELLSMAGPAAERAP